MGATNAHAGTQGAPGRPGPGIYQAPTALPDTTPSTDALSSHFPATHTSRRLLIAASSPLPPRSSPNSRTRHTMSAAMMKARSAAAVRPGQARASAVKVNAIFKTAVKPAPVKQAANGKAGTGRVVS